MHRWIAQFIPGNREDTFCRRDGTLRLSEPDAAENLSCFIPFFVIYYFLVAAAVWFAIFTYAWYLQTIDRGSFRDRIDKGNFYFHFIAWALPFVLTVLIAVLNKIDGNSIVGICFVGYRNPEVRIGLVILPFVILSIIIVIFTTKGVFNLNRIKQCANSNNESERLSSHIKGMGIRTMLVVLFMVVVSIFEWDEIRNAEHWANNLHDLIT